MALIFRAIFLCLYRYFSAYGRNTNMEKVTLAKALKVRKRLVQQLSKLDEKIGRNNSVLEGNAREASVVSFFPERKELVEKLVALKLAMYRANDGIQEQIFQIAELKGFIQQLQSLDTKEGKIESYSFKGDTVYNAELKKGDVENLIATTEAEIDVIQDKIDKYNHTTEVVLP